MMVEAKLSANVAIDDERDVLIVYGIKIAGALLRSLGTPTRPGYWLRVVSAENGIATVEEAPATEIAEQVNREAEK